MNVKRQYDASGRQRKARERRLAVVLAAKELFQRDGFVRTTMTIVAAQAGVSVETVYRGFGSKAGLAKAVFDVEIAGDDAEVAVADRPESRSVIDEPDVRRKVELYVEGFVERQQRSAWIQLLIRDAGHGDETAARVWQEVVDERFRGMTLLARHLLATGQLRPGVGLPDARDVLWVFTSVDLYDSLVGQRQWSLARYARWTTRMITNALL